jgi:Mg/Co/Ni transporter MgtE
MAGPLITTIVDALALTIYFSLATKFLNIWGDGESLHFY